MADEQVALPEWLQWMPYASGGFGALGAIMNLIQNIQAKRQQESLRRYFSGAWQGAAQSALSRLVGDAASRGWSGYGQGLANMVAKAYAPYQLQAGQLMQGTMNPIAGPVNPFDAFLKSLTAIRGMQGGQQPGMGSAPQVGQTVPGAGGDWMPGPGGGPLPGSLGQEDLLTGFGYGKDTGG